MREANLRILKMVEEGKISADKASELIEAMEKQEIKPVMLSETYKSKMLKIKVDSADGDKVNVNLPVTVISAVLKATGKLPIKVDGLEGIDINQVTATIVAAFENELVGEIVNVESADGDYVRIVIE